MGLGVYGWRPRTGTFGPDEPTLAPVGKPYPLYDGGGVQPPDWKVAQGMWKQDRDAEGGQVLSGQGVALRRLNPPLLNYRVAMGVDLNQASAVEVHFGTAQKAPGGQPRGVLRLTRDGAVLGRRRDDRGALETASPLVPFAAAVAGGSPYREVRVERQGMTWWAFFDGRPVGSLPVIEQMELAEIRLVTEGGPAFFESLEAVELGPPRG